MESLAIASQTAEARHPDEGPFHDPATEPQDDERLLAESVLKPLNGIDLS